jgi:serine phosphatase RsbU (regulator of sigma subunit)
LLNQIVSDQGITDPATILQLLDEKIVAALNMGSGVENSSDGMDITIVRIHKITREVSLASANRPVFLVRGKELTQLKADKLPIGEYYIASKIFTTQIVDSEKGDRLYLFSDGYSDQFGGERGKKLKLKEFRTLVHSISHLSMEEQQHELSNFFKKWKGDREQLDDVLVIGIRV